MIIQTSTSKDSGLGRPSSSAVSDVECFSFSFPNTELVAHQLLYSYDHRLERAEMPYPCSEELTNFELLDGID